MNVVENELVQYWFRDAVAGFFEFPTDRAAAVLPAELQPVERRHGMSVLSIMAFDFSDSMVGEYGELILSILVSPLLKPGEPFPRSAFYPFQLGTTTRESREHAIERWHLPHYMRDIELRWNRGASDVTIEAADGQPMLSLRVTPHDWSTVEHRYQSFMNDESGAYTATIIMEGEFSENEEERGGLTIEPHGMGAQLESLEPETTPFRELWMRDGVQTFHPLETLTAGSARG